MGNLPCNGYFALPFGLVCACALSAVNPLLFLPSLFCLLFLNRSLLISSPFPVSPAAAPGRRCPRRGLCREQRRGQLRRDPSAAGVGSG